MTMWSPLGPLRPRGPRVPSGNSAINVRGEGKSGATVGPRGMRTRQRLFQAALHVLAQAGMGGYSVEAVASRADVARSTVYQYFGSKDDILAELAEMVETELVRLVRRLGPLGPTVYGFENLRWWLAEFVYLYQNFAPVFLLWSEALPRRTAPLAPDGAFVRAFAGAIDQRLRDAEAPGPAAADSEAISLAILAAAERTGQFLQLPSVNEADLLEALGASMQCTLFPATPGAVLRAVLG